LGISADIRTFNITVGGTTSIVVTLTAEKHKELALFLTLKSNQQLKE